MQCLLYGQLSFGGGWARWPGKCVARSFFVFEMLACNVCQIVGVFFGGVLACNVRHLGRTVCSFLQAFSAWVLLALELTLISLAHFGLRCLLHWAQCLFSVWHFGPSCVLWWKGRAFFRGSMLDFGASLIRRSVFLGGN